MLRLEANVENAEESVNRFITIQDDEKFERKQTGRNIANFASHLIVHVLDGLLLIMLLPYILWQRTSGNDRLMIALKAILEIVLELVMWMIFAGVSILMVMMFLVEDVYFKKNGVEKLRRMLMHRYVCPSENDSPGPGVKPDPRNVPQMEAVEDSCST